VRYQEQVSFPFERDNLDCRILRKAVSELADVDIQGAGVEEGIVAPNVHQQLLTIEVLISVGD